MNKLILWATALMVHLCLDVSSQNIDTLDFCDISTTSYLESITGNVVGVLDSLGVIERQNHKFQRWGRVTDKVITVVFHVVSSPGMMAVSEEEVMFQLDALNRDFGPVELRGRNLNEVDSLYMQSIGDPKIQFCIPENGLLNSIVNGIVRKSLLSLLPLTDNIDRIKHGLFGGSEIIRPKDYLNIWITDLQDSTAGYASPPGFPREDDGIVVDRKYFGYGNTENEGYNEGKTLTHLIGNYLGLHPLWGKHPCSDDYIEDTPIHNAPNYGRPEANHISTCYRDLSDPMRYEMPMNFMDNTYDDVRYMFTKNQVRRMHAALDSSGWRFGLVAHEDNICHEEYLSGRSNDNDILGGDKVLSVWPNPVRNEVNIDITAGLGNDLTLYDLKGTRVYSQNLAERDRTVTIAVRSDWPPGIYFVTISKEGQVIQSQKIIIQ